MNAEEIKKDWKQRGFSFGIWADSPGQVWQDFIHDVDELFRLAEGEVSVTIDNKTIVAIVGEEVFIPAGSVHTVITSKQGGSVWYYGYQEKQR